MYDRAGFRPPHPRRSISLNHRRVLLIVSLILLFTSAANAASLASAAKRGQVDVVRSLIESGEDIDHRGRGGATPIYFAAQKGHADVVRLLAEAGADLDADNNFGSTALHVASRYGHVDVIRVLVEFGAALNPQNMTGGTESLINPRGTANGLVKSSTPLSKAARAGQFEAVKVLIELGVQLPAPDAAREASRKGHDEIAAFITRATTERKKQRRKNAAANSAATLAANASQVIDPSADYGRKIAVVVGISRYQRLSHLEGASRDAKAMAEVLRGLGFDAVYELYDKDATRSRILELVGQKLRAETKENDLAFIFFAGHGATETLANGEKRGYLVPTEGSTEDPYVTGISMETVRELSNRLAAKHVYYAVDACYSGGLVDAKGAGIVTRGGNRNSSVQVLTAGLEGQQAIERDGRGVFTTYLVKGLQGEANMNGDAFVTASEIGWFVANQVDQVTRGKQTPVYGRLGGTGEVVFRLR